MNTLLKILKIGLVIFGIFWVLFVQIIATVAYDQAVNITIAVTGWSEESIGDSSDPEEHIEGLENLFDTTFFQIYLLTSFVFALLGAIILTRKRSIYDAMWLFIAFLLPREKRAWGEVKDSITNKPIAFATVRLYESNNLISEAITDIDGRYKLSANKSIAAGNLNLEIKSDGYRDQTLNLSDLTKLRKAFQIDQDIFLTRGDENNQMKYQFIYYKPILYSYLIWIIYIFSFIYLILFVYYLTLYEISFYGNTNLLLYAFSFIWNTYVIRQRFFNPYKKILDLQSNTPIEGAMIGLFKQDKQHETKLSDKQGQVKFSVKPGEYKARVSRAGYIMWDKDKNQEIVFSDVKLKEDGSLSKNIYLKKVKETNETYANPFG